MSYSPRSRRILLWSLAPLLLLVVVMAIYRHRQWVNPRLLDGASLEGIVALRFSPDGQMLTSGQGSTDTSESVEVWNARYGGSLGHLELPAVGSSPGASQLDWSPDGKVVGMANDFSSMGAIWDVSTRKYLWQWFKNCDSLRFSPNGRWIATGGWDRADFEGSYRLQLQPSKPGKVRWKRTVDWLSSDRFESRVVGWSSDSQYVLLLAGGKLNWLDAATGKTRYRTPLHGQLSPDGTLMAESLKIGEVRVWKNSPVPDSKPLATLRGVRPDIVRFSPDNSLIALAQRARLAVWNWKSKRLVREVSVAAGRKVTALDVSPDNAALAVATARPGIGDGELVTWRLR